MESGYINPSAYASSFHVMPPTRKTVVMSIGQLVVNKDWMCVVLVLETVGHAIDLVLGDFDSRPSIPLKGGCFAETTETSYQSTGRHGKGVAAIIRSFDGDGETVGEQ